MPVYDIAKKANVVPIIQAHVDTMADFRGNKRSVWDLLFFYGLPVVTAAVLVFERFAFFLDSVNGFLNAFSILTGLMLNLLVLVFTLSAATQSKASTHAEKADYIYKRKVLKEVFVTVCYCILVAVGVVIVALFSLSYLHQHANGGTDRVSTFLLVFLTGNFLLSLLMVIKRMYKLILHEFDRPNLQRAA